MEELRVASDRFVKQANGWFLDRYLTRHKGKDHFWSPKADEKHLDWNSGEAHGKDLKGMQPSIFELQSLKDYTKSNPCILDCARVLEISTDDCYWTRETTAWSSAGAWYVVFNGGSVNYNGKVSGYFVRPVRSQ
jgi:hypothetical protein